MVPREIRFVSRNKHKLKEAVDILKPYGIKVIPLNIKLEELQTEDTKGLVRDKLLKAFRKVGRPLFVEHTGLYLERLNGLPGGLTQVFWDRLRADQFSSLYGARGSCKAMARTILGYTDSRRIHIFDGEVCGQIISGPRGNRDFQWDCVFIPSGAKKTFAELGSKKNEISMRRVAIDKFAEFLLKGLSHV